MDWKFEISFSGQNPQKKLRKLASTFHIIFHRDLRPQRRQRRMDRMEKKDDQRPDLTESQKHTARRVEKCFIKIYSLHRSDDCWLLALSSLCDILALFMWHVQCRYVIKLLSCLVVDASSRGCVFFMTLDHHFLVVIIASFHFLFSSSLSLFQAAIFHLFQSAKKSADDVKSAHTECLSERTLSHRATLTIPKW